MPQSVNKLVRKQKGMQDLSLGAHSTDVISNHIVKLQQRNDKKNLTLILTSVAYS